VPLEPEKKELQNNVRKGKIRKKKKNIAARAAIRPGIGVLGSERRVWKNMNFNLACAVW